MSSSTLPLLELLEAIWAELQIFYPDLPDVVLRLSSGQPNCASSVLTLGHWWADRWIDAGRHTYGEVMISGDGLALGAESLLNTLLHEAAHALAVARKIRDTSRQGQYHNGRFRDLAIDLGLEVERTRHRGWSQTSLTEATRERYQQRLLELEEAISIVRRRFNPHARPTVPKRMRQRLACACRPDPRLIYIAPGIATRGAIICDLCGWPFEP